jgi:hypothetical protein
MLLQPNYESASKRLTQRASVRLGLLRRLVCLGRPFTKPWGNPINEAEEVPTRRDRHL